MTRKDISLGYAKKLIKDISRYQLLAYTAGGSALIEDKIRFRYLWVQDPEHTLKDIVIKMVGSW